MSEPHTARLRVAVESECYNVNPVATQGRTTRDFAPKDKIECDRYADEDDKGRQDSEGSFRVESAKVLADRQCLHFQKPIGNEIAGEREKYPYSYPPKQSVVRRINVMLDENQSHSDAA